MHYMVIDTFLNPTWLTFVQSELLKFQDKLSREGYNNEKTLRDSLDPRHAETTYITDPRNMLCRIWEKFLWGTSIESDMENSEDSALVHATHTRFGRTLLSSYGNGDGYGGHVDVQLDCVVTAVLMLTIEDQKFTGGNFVLGNKEIEFKNNRLIIFPSCRMHSVTEVSLDKDIYRNRRFTLQYFISSVTPNTRFPDESSII